jgi:hypothetical protein
MSVFLDCLGRVFVVHKHEMSVDTSYNRSPYGHQLITVANVKICVRYNDYFGEDHGWKLVAVSLVCFNLPWQSSRLFSIEASLYIKACYFDPVSATITSRARVDPAQLLLSCLFTGN